MSTHFIDIWYGNIISDENLFDKLIPECRQEHTYWSLLSSDEREKASNYTRQDLQKKYIEMRALLRKILSPYLNIEPQNIIIKTGEYGKPYLPKTNIVFNLSHTNNKFVAAVSNIGELGVDIEKNKNRKSLSALVEKCYSQEESHYWNSLDEENKVVMFYRFWVRKEAFVKAVGRGLGLGLDQCIVNPKEQTRFMCIPDEYGLPSNWRIIDIPIDQDHTCAVVTNGTKFDCKQTELK